MQVRKIPKDERRDRKYEQWIRSHPCHLCGTSGTECHHVGDGIHTARRLPYAMVPLCRSCHQRAHKQPAIFKLKLREDAKEYQERYKLLVERK